MSHDGQRQLPRWLRSERVQPFVLTICAAGQLQDTLALLRGEFDDFEFDPQDSTSSRVCEIDFDCEPARAWSLLQSLQAKLDNADICIQPRTQLGKRLLICDMDMTIVAAETLDEVASMLGLGEPVAAITARAMHGEIDFNEALRERIGMLAGQPEQLFHDVARTLQLNSGAEQLLQAAQAAGVHTILISGGFAQVAEPVAARLGFDEVICNRLQLDAGRLTGALLEPIVNADIKCQMLQQRAQALGIELADCCAIGDGANDLPMLMAAGLGIAYHAKPVLRAATNCHIDATDLSSAIHFMGLDHARDP